MNNATQTDTVTIPVSGGYRLNTDLSTVSFATRHMFGLGPVNGTFRLRDGHVHVIDPVQGTSVRATISAGSFDTGLSARDVAVRSAQYLDAENHPDITFASTGLDQVDGRWTLYGSLTVRGRTRPIEVRVDEVRQHGPRLRLRATASVDRYEFGITAMKGVTGRHLTLGLDITADRT
jgi:polyisoprenoid-binding protein YceI